MILKNTFHALMLMIICSSCSFISGPEGLFPETKNNFFNEQLLSDLELPADSALELNTDDHYPAFIKDIPGAEVQNIPSPRQIFSSSQSQEVQLRRLGELMWIYVETLPSTSWPIAKNYFEASEMNVLSADPEAGIMTIAYPKDLVIKVAIEHGIKESSTEIFLSIDSGSLDSGQGKETAFIQNQLEQLVEYFASSVSSFSGTSLAAQNLNDRKKTKIYNLNDRTVIELSLGFDRAWSAVSRALTEGNIVTNDLNRDEGIFLVSYSEESEGTRWFSFLNFSNDDKQSELNLKSQAEFKIVLEKKEEKTNIYVESLEASSKSAEALISKINELLS